MRIPRPMAAARINPAMTYALAELTGIVFDPH